MKKLLALLAMFALLAVDYVRAADVTARAMMDDDSNFGQMLDSSADEESIDAMAEDAGAIIDGSEATEVEDEYSVNEDNMLVDRDGNLVMDENGQPIDMSQYNDEFFVPGDEGDASGDENMMIEEIPTADDANPAEEQ